MAHEAAPQKPIEAGVLDLWKQACEEFYSQTNASQNDRKIMELQPSPEKWLETFEKDRHKKDWGRVYKRMGKYLTFIQTTVEALAFGFGIASDVKFLLRWLVEVPFVAPVVAPATYIVNAFSWVLASFAKVSDEFNKIEEFFETMVRKFQDLSIIKDTLQRTEMEIIRRRVVDLFACSLEICAIGIREPGKRFKVWISKMCGENKLDELLAKFDKLDGFLRDAVRLATHERVSATHENVSGFRSQIHQLDSRLSTDLRDIKLLLQTTPAGENQWKAILNWLSPLDYLAKYNELIDRVHERPSAGQWLLKSTPFQCWQDGQNNKLWYQGEPGAGKSILATIVIRHLHKTLASGAGSKKQAAITYLYHSNEKDLEINVLLGSILRQVLSTYAGVNALPDEAKSVLEQYQNNGAIETTKESSPRPNRLELEQILRIVAADRSLYLVIDAMDECAHKTRLELIKSLGNIPELKIMVTSRLIEHQEYLAKDFQVHRIEAHPDDINDYIDSVLRGNPILQGHELRIKEEVGRKSKRIFLLTRLHMAELETVALESHIEAALQDLPEDPEQCYSTAVKRMKRSTEEKQKIAFETLAWIAYSLRPLTEDELIHALSFNKQEDKIRPTAQHLLSIADISGYCCGLVVPDMEKTVRFVHYSAKEYFRSHKDTLFGGFHLVAAWTCAKYLCSIEIDFEIPAKDEADLSSADGSTSGDDDNFPSTDEYTSENRDFKFNLANFPFASYAGAYMHKHYEVIRNQPKESVPSTLNFSIPSRSLPKAATQTFITHAAVIDLIDSIIENSDRRGFYLNVLESQESYYEYHSFSDSTWSSRRSWSYRRSWPSTRSWSTDPVACTPLHLAVFVGCPALVEKQLAKDIDVDELDSHGQSSLIIAFKKRFADIAGLLLDQGAWVDLSTERGHALLLYAAQMNYVDAVQAIISQNAGLEGVLAQLLIFMSVPVIILVYLVGTLISDTRLVLLAERIPKLLSTKENRGKLDEEPNTEFKAFCEVLLAAYNGDSKRISQLLLQLESEDEPLGEGPTCSSASSSSDSGSEGSTKYDVCSRQPNLDTFLSSACFLAVEGEHTQAVEVLLEHGVCINRKNDQGQTLLHRATARNNSQLVKHLLNKNADVHQRDHKGRNALIANANTERKEVLELLIQNGANIRDFSDTDVEVHEIYRAAAHGKIEMVKFFLQHGVDASTFGDNGWTALHAAAANGHVDCVQVLLKEGAKASAISDTGKTPLDFVKDHETLYDIPLLGETHDECEAYRKQHENFPDMDQRYDIIETLLRKHEARTSEELYNSIGDEFLYGEGGQYTHKYYEGTHYQSRIAKFAARKRHSGL